MLDGTRRDIECMPTVLGGGDLGRMEAERAAIEVFEDWAEAFVTPWIIGPDDQD
jgi:hypothetical protein